MRFDCSNEIGLKQAQTYLSSLKGYVEIKDVKKKRTLSQNAYLHVIITLFGIHFGYTIEEAKTLLKRECHFMVYEKNGNKFLRKTSKMNTKELTDFIDWVRNYASQNGCYLPTADEYSLKRSEIDNTIKYNSQFL